MERRRNQWGSFWGCCDYPECRGLVRIEDGRRAARPDVVAQAKRERRLTPEDADVMAALPANKAMDAVAALRGLLAALGALAVE